jgi:integrase
MSAGRRDAKPKPLTQTQIADLTPRTGEQFVAWDPTLPGFGVRVSPSGTKAFIVKYRLHTGRVRWKTIGRVGALPLEKARKQAQTDIGLVASGKDPLTVIDAARDAVTLAAAADRFLEEHVTAKRKPATLRLYRLVIDAHLKPRLGALPIAEVDTDAAVKLHHRLKATPYLANRAIAVLSKLIAWSMTAKLRPAGANPCVGIEKYRERKRRRYLDAGEYARVGRALRAARQAGTIAPAPLTAIELLLLTGCRPQEIATLQWAHVDLTGAALNLPDSKTGEKVVHLPGPAVQILKRWPRWAHSPYVFPGNGRGESKGAHIHATTLAHTWADVRSVVQLDDVRLYDACRHSFASMAVSQHGLTLAQIGEQLGHSQPATTARYAHLHNDVAKRHATAIGGSIASALKRRAR